MEPIFTHYFVFGFGWENTVYTSEDFATVEEIGATRQPESTILFAAKDENGTTYILKGHYK